MTFRLFVDSANGVTVTPEFNLEDSAEKIETRTRVRDGSEFVYKYGEFQIIKLEVLFVNSNFKSIVNSWWSSNTDLLWMEEGGTQVSSVRIISKKQPISKFQKPYTNLFNGKIELGSY